MTRSHAAAGRRVAMLDRDGLLSALAAALWREREAADAVLYKLVQQRLFVAAGDPRWLARSDDETREALDRLRACGRDRAGIAVGVGAALALAPDASLVQYVERVDEPWRMLLADHRAALRLVLTDIAAEAAITRRLVRADSADARSAGIDDTVDPAAAICRSAILSTVEDVLTLPLRDFVGGLER